VPDDDGPALVPDSNNSFDNDRHGKPHYYFRYRGQRWPIPAPGAEGFATAYDGLLAHIKANPFRSNATIEYMPGSLGWAIEKFLGSPLYSNRADSTKRNYRRILDQLRQKWGAGLLADLQPHHVRQIRNELAAKSTSTADIGVGLISTLWNFATEQLGQHKLGADPAYSIKRVHEGKREHALAAGDKRTVHVRSAAVATPGRQAGALHRATAF